MFFFFLKNRKILTELCNCVKYKYIFLLFFFGFISIEKIWMVKIYYNSIEPWNSYCGLWVKVQRKEKENRSMGWIKRVNGYGCPWKKGVKNLSNIYNNFILLFRVKMTEKIFSIEIIIGIIIVIKRRNQQKKIIISNCIIHAVCTQRINKFIKISFPSFFYFFFFVEKFFWFTVSFPGTEENSIINSISNKTRKQYNHSLIDICYRSFHLIDS